MSREQTLFRRHFGKRLESFSQPAVVVCSIASIPPWMSADQQELIGGIYQAAWALTQQQLVRQHWLHAVAESN